MRRAWAMWQHGLAVGVVYGLCLFLMGVSTYILLAIGSSVLGLFGWEFSDDGLISLGLWLAPLWVPFGLGYAAHYAPTAELRPE